jgi:hypothetical protein
VNPHPIYLHLEGGGSMYLQKVDIHWQYGILLNPDKYNLKEGKNLLLF